jgi:hypothetical protein
MTTKEDTERTPTVETLTLEDQEEGSFQEAVAALILAEAVEAKEEAEEDSLTNLVTTSTSQTSLMLNWLTDSEETTTTGELE